MRQKCLVVCSRACADDCAWYGWMLHSSIDAGIRMRPFADEQDELGPEFRDVWAKVYERAPDKPVVWLGPSAM